VNVTWVSRHQALVQIVLVVAGLALGVLAYRVQMENRRDDPGGEIPCAS
jgi:hypothetical protein